MNEYEIETFEMYRRPDQTQKHRVRAHSAADALTCFEKSVHLHDGYVSRIRCVEASRQPNVPAEPAWTQMAPDADGYYWLSGWPARLVSVVGGDVYFPGVDGAHPMDQFADALWSGPLKEPSP